jgi:signal transduction histidine kinase/ActR/RegA family two-component response regulator
MPVRVKIVIVLSFAFVLLVASVCLVHRCVLLPSFARLEGEQADRDLSRCIEAVRRDVEHLSLFCRDWACWDDTYRFVIDGNEQFKKQNLGAETFLNARLNLIAFLGREGQLTWGGAMDWRTQKPLPFSRIFARIREHRQQLLCHTKLTGEVSGILLTEMGPMLVASRPILTSDNKGPIHGTLLMGRMLDAEAVRELSNRVSVPLELWVIPGGVPCHERRALARLHSAGDRFLSAEHREIMHAYAALFDVLGQPALLMHANMLRSITKQGSVATRIAMLVSIIGGTLIMLLLWLTLQRTVAAPLAAVTQHVMRVRRDNDLGLRLAMRRRDEIGTLAEEFDSMVARLAKFRERIQEAKEAAEACSRAKSEFLANMSHEIRTPITAILGYVDIMLDEDIGHVIRQHAEVIRRNGEHLLGLINDVLDLSKVEVGRMQIEPIRCSPVQVVAEVVSLMRVRAEAKHLTLQTDVAGPLPETVLTDPLRLRQVLVNLVGNAIKFTDQGEVSLAVRLIADQGCPRLRFDVTDTGIGINEEHLKRLFHPFTQVDTSSTRRFGGTGLGLCISKRLAEALGGSIEVHSTPGKGSSFSVTIDPGPLDGIRMVENAQDTLLDYVPRTTVTAPGKTECCGRILLAEDALDNQRLIGLLLKKAGNDVVTVENGEQAVEQASVAWRQGRPFDVILMDMQMPVMDGYSATRCLREQGYTRPIIALTAHAMAEDRQKCLDAGCDDYATKPIDRPRLLATIARWMAGSQAHGDSSDATVGEGCRAPQADVSD